MVYFIATVVVHHHTSAQDYARLHDAMARMEFMRHICGNDGNWYEMPHSTYVSVKPDNVDVNQLRDFVARVVDTTLPSSTPAHVLVVATDRMAWRLRLTVNPLLSRAA